MTVVELNLRSDGGAAVFPVKEVLQFWWSFNESFQPFYDFFKKPCCILFFKRGGGVFLFVILDAQFNDIHMNQTSVQVGLRVLKFSGARGGYVCTVQ